MENNICNSMILTSRRRHFYLVGQSKSKIGACGVNNQASAVLAGNEIPFVAFRRYNKSNDGCGESNSTVPKNSADEKNCADGAKLCTNETEPSASKGAESARMFCGIMNLPPPPQNSQKYNHILLQATRETCEHSMAEAVREAVDENDGKRDLAVAVDGSWQKRGFSSKNGLVMKSQVLIPAKL
ncbi:uncharacterized protein TNCV_139511 [Trichonephila clavipes]|uniref:Mutator-like transposase domain-containing protein n=1 Tax=Trichonephila clavipes TaxID=2585209 RepID=A0A8X6RI67_TRICX|nr:uncharacterized protein TNCV_139511 [Trichonephila clavipes]